MEQKIERIMQMTDGYLERFGRGGLGFITCRRWMKIGVL